MIRTGQDIIKGILEMYSSINSPVELWQEVPQTQPIPYGKISMTTSNLFSTLDTTGLRHVLRIHIFDNDPARLETSTKYFIDTLDRKSPSDYGSSIVMGEAQLLNYIMNWENDTSLWHAILEFAII